MNIEVIRYQKPDGHVTRYWAVMVNGELLAVILYRKGAEAVARMITNSIVEPDPEGYRPGLDRQGASSGQSPCDTGSQHLVQLNEGEPACPMLNDGDEASPNPQKQSQHRPLP